VSQGVEILRDVTAPNIAANSSQSVNDDLPTTVVERRPGWRSVNVRELWSRRELLYFLAWRDVKVRYKQTVLGAAWALLQPFATMLVFTLFLGRLIHRAEGDVPYALFVIAALVPWTFFANAISSAAQSVVLSQTLVTKVYFPRIMIPMGAVAATLVDLLIAIGLLLGMMFYYHVRPDWHCLLVPWLILGLLIVSLGIGALLAALTVAYRDFRHVIPFMVQLWMFATPNIYMRTEQVVSARWLRWLPLNPAYGLIANFRAAALGQPLDLYSLGVSGAVSLVLLAVGCFYFRRVERTFADII
jgi:lipopolysaccharide transport system permease protein